MQLWRTLTVVNAAVLLDGHDLKTLDPTWLRCVLMRVAGFARSDRCLFPAYPTFGYHSASLFLVQMHSSARPFVSLARLIYSSAAALYLQIAPIHPSPSASYL